LISKFLAKTKLHLTYKRYPADLSYSIYLTKMLDAFDIIDTPYAVCASDDDFYNCDLLYAAVDFLNSNRRYSAWCGETLDFRIQPSTYFKTAPKFVSGTFQANIAGRFCAGRYQDMTSIISESAQIRLSDFSTVHPYEAVHKTANWKKTFKIAKDANVYNYRLLDRLLRYVTLLEGSFFYYDEIFLLRQSNTDSHEGMDLITWQNPSDLHFIMTPSFMECLRKINDEVFGSVKVAEAPVSPEWLRAHLANSSLDFIAVVLGSNRKWVVGGSSGVSNLSKVLLETLHEVARRIHQRLPYFSLNLRRKDIISVETIKIKNTRFLQDAVDVGVLDRKFLFAVENLQKVK